MLRTLQLSVRDHFVRVSTSPMRGTRVVLRVIE